MPEMLARVADTHFPLVHSLRTMRATGGDVTHTEPDASAANPDPDRPSGRAFWQFPCPDLVAAIPSGPLTQDQDPYTTQPGMPPYAGSAGARPPPAPPPYQAPQVPAPYAAQQHLSGVPAVPPAAGYGYGYGYGNGYPPQTPQPHAANGMYVAAAIINWVVLGLVVLATLGLGLIAAAWFIPMTIYIHKGGRDTSKHTALGVCTLLFCNIVSGILILVADGSRHQR